MGDRAVAKRTNKLCAVSTNAVDDIRQGRSHSAKKHLQVSQKEGKLLLHQVRQLIEQITPLKSYFKEKEVTVLKEKERLENEIKQLENEISRCRNTKSWHEIELKRTSSSLENAQRERSNLVAKQKELQGKMDTYNVVKWIPIVGPIAMIVEAIEDNEGKLSKAKRHVTQIEDEIRGLRSSISDCEDTIQSQNKRVSEIRSSIYTMSAECSELSSNHSNVCDAIANLQEAKHTLEIFADITEYGNDSSQFLEELVDSASKLGHKKSAKELRSAEYHALTTDYLEKWKELQELVRSVHLHFSISFRCTKCYSNNKGLPWLYHGNLICEQCWRSI